MSEAVNLTLKPYRDLCASKKPQPMLNGLAKVPALNSTLFPHQAHGVDFALRTGRAGLFYDTGLGKALRHDWPVATPRGFVTIGSLKIGDKVFGRDGKETEVTGVFPQGLRELYRVEFSDGAETVCDAEHLWAVNSKLRRRRGNPWRILTLAEIQREGLKDGLGWRHFIPMPELIEYPERLLPLDPYLLGALLGDGHLGKNSVSITTDDALVAALKLPRGVTPSLDEKISAYTSTYRLSGAKWQSNAITEELRGMGLAGCGSQSKFIPAIYQLASVEQRKALLAGLLDSDGHVRPKDGNIEYGTISKRLANDVADLVRSLGGTASVRVKLAPKYRHKGEARSGQTYYRMSVRLPASLGNPFRLARKAVNWKPLTKYAPQRAITKIESAGKNHAVCIKVAADDHLFIIQNYVVTHNTAMMLEWGHHIVRETNKPVMMLAPLAVGSQHVREAERIGIEAQVSRFGTAPDKPCITITNYERLEKFDPAEFGGIILDESSILKSFTGKTTRKLIETFNGYRFRLAGTATPAPNDHTELGQHSEFLGVMARDEMLTRWFLHDSMNTKDWRLKRHAVRPFWDWVASWARCVSKPSDLGFSDDGFVLPPLNVQRHIISADRSENSGEEKDGQMRLFRIPDRSATAIHKEKRMTISDRAAKVAELVSAIDGKPCVIWVDTDYEAEAVRAAIPTCFEVHGKMHADAKEAKLDAFSRGEISVLLTKPSIAGFGLNWQHCHNTIFAGVNFSYESYYQALRRFWRFGQKNAVNAHVVCADTELEIASVVDRKSTDHETMKRMMAESMKRAAVTKEVFEAYQPGKEASLPGWL